MKKLLILLLIAIAVFSVQNICAEEMNSGILCENVSWNLSEDGTLTIKGSGRIETASYDTPWYRYYKIGTLHAGGPVPQALIDRPIRNVIIGEGITSIPNGFFQNCVDIEAVKLPESLEKLGSSAFFRCTSLTGIALPDNLREIGAQAFAHCPIKELRLPSGIDSVRGSEFAEMSLLEEIIVPAENGNYVFENGRLYNKAKTALYFYRIESDNDDVYIEDGVSHIGDYVFCYKNMNKLVLPERIESVGACAFKGSKVNEGNFPSSVKYLGDSCFAYCPWLTYADISSVRGMSSGVFAQCINLENVIMPVNIRAIGEEAFHGCSKLRYVTINPGTTYIGKYAFRNCTALENIRFSPELQTIDSRAFEGCTNLKNPVLPSSLKVIGDAAFNGCAGITYIKLPSGLGRIGNFAFQFCTGLRKLVIPENVVSIGEMAFCACDSLTELAFTGPYIDIEYEESNKRIMDARFTLNIYYNKDSGWEKGREFYPDANWIEGIPESIYEPQEYETAPSDGSGSLTAYLPAFEVTINGQKIDNSYRQYPFLQYRNIVYFPMTYYDARFLGVETLWDDYNYKMTVNKAYGSGVYNSYDWENKNDEAYTIERCYHSLSINGKDVVAVNDPYPPIKFRDVIYFPLTWRYAHDEFGWEYHFDNETGLSINSK